MQATGVTAQEYMENWLLQINYPEISITVNNSGANTLLSFKQERYSVTEIDEEYLFQPIISPFKYS